MHVITQSDLDTPQTMSQSFSRLERLNAIDKELAHKLKKSVGFRNIAVHNYGELDLNLAFEIATSHIHDFQDFVKQILTFECTTNNSSR